MFLLQVLLEEPPEPDDEPEERFGPELPEPEPLDFPELPEFDDEPVEPDEPLEPPELEEPLELPEPLEGVEGEAAGVFFDEPLSLELDPGLAFESELPPPSPEEPPLLGEEPALP